MSYDTEARVPTLEQILHVINTMPTNSDIELRNQALIAFTVLTGVRDGAIASLKLKHIDLRERRVIQDAREVRTKFSKSFSTYFFSVGEEIEQIALNWVQHLKTRLFGDGDALFPATRVDREDGHFAAAGLDRKHWSNATPIRTIFREAFNAYRRARMATIKNQCPSLFLPGPPSQTRTRAQHSTPAEHVMAGHILR